MGACNKLFMMKANNFLMKNVSNLVKECKYLIAWSIDKISV